MIITLVVLSTITAKQPTISITTDTVSDTRQIHRVSHIDTLPYEPIPHDDTHLQGKISLILTNAYYGQNSDFHKQMGMIPQVKNGEINVARMDSCWIVHGLLINGTDSDLVVPHRMGDLTSIDLKLIRNGSPLTDGNWCGTLTFLKGIIFYRLPANSLHKFSIPIFSSGIYSASMETRDFETQSNEIEIR